MKIQKWHLFVFVFLLFGFSFYVINLKFDKFYRVNGINNDNRVLIEKYLTKNEQSFLIDNQIKITEFIDYIEYDEFDLSNYQYYNLLKDTQRYSKKIDVLTVGNELASRLNYLFEKKALTYATKLVDFSLESAFLNETYFDFEYIDLYASLSRLYAIDDYSYINDTHNYISKLNDMGISNKEDLNQAFLGLVQSYSKDALNELLNTELKDGVSIVFNPSSLSSVVNQNHYIGKYEPSELLLIQEIPRMRYAMYLQNDAYNALLDMYNDISNSCDGFLLRDSYKSYETLKADKIGFDEFQLGLSIVVSKQGIAYNQFDETDVSDWLKEHAHEYGFILRYPKNKASLTGYTYDPHIYRYVGKDLAKILYDSSLCLDEYKTTQE